MFLNWQCCLILLGTLTQTSASLDASLETSHGSAARKSPATTNHSEQPNNSPVLLKAVKKEVSDDSVDSEVSFRTNTTTVSKDYTKRSNYGNSANYAPSSNNMEMNDKSSDNVDNKDVKSRHCSRISSGIIS